MARPRTLPDDHFCFSTFRKGDSTYVYGYRNEWDPEKKQSRIAKRIYVGTLNEITGRVKLGKITYQIILSTKARRFILKIAPSLKDPSKRLQQKSGNAKLHGLQTIFLMLPPGPFGSSHPRIEFCKTYRRSLENNWEPTSWL